MGESLCAKRILRRHPYLHQGGLLHVFDSGPAVAGFGGREEGRAGLAAPPLLHAGNDTPNGVMFIFKENHTDFPF